MSVQRSMAKGIVWMVMLRLVDRSLGLVSTMVLARLLVPEDFGLIAMAMAVIAMLELMSLFGFDMALIQRQQVGRAHYDTAWTFNLLFGIFSWAMLNLLAGPAAEFWREPRLEAVLNMLAFIPLIRGFENIGIVAFRKELQFHKEFRLNLLKRVSGVSVTVGLAWYYRDYHALIVGTLFQYSLGVVLSYILHPYRPRPCLSAWHDLMGFSKWLVLNNVMLFFRQRSPDMILGRIAGTAPLGQFTVAYEIANLPSTELLAPINRAIYPGYSKMSSDLAQLREGFINIAGLMALVVLPASIGLSAVADLLVPLMLGDKWLAAIPLIQILALAGAIQPFVSHVVPIFMALNKVHITSVFTLATLLLLVASSYWLASLEGATGVAKALLLTWALTVPAFLLYSLKELGLSVAEYGRAVWRQVVAAAVMYAAVRMFVSGMGIATDVVTLLLELLAAVLLGAIVFVAIELGLWWMLGRPDGVESLVLSKVLPRIMERVRVWWP